VRKSILFSVCGVVLLVAAAGAVRFAVRPSLQQLPAHLDTTLHFAGTANLLDASAMQTGNLAAAFRNNVPVTAQEHVRVISTHGRTAVVTDETSLAGADGTKLATSSHTWAVDRKSLDAAPAPAGSAAQPHEGLVVGFPLSPKPHDYPYWDSLTQTRATASYQRTERHGGRRTYVYTVHASGALKDTALVAGLPTALPKTVLLGLAGTLPAAVRDGLAASAAVLPDQLPLSYAATGDSTYRVDTETGYVIDVNQKQSVVASIPLGTASIPLPSVFAVDMHFTPASVEATSRDAATAERGLFLIGTGVPAALLALAVLLVLLSLWLAVRRWARPAGQPVETEPDAAPTAVGASEDG
jgi:Porin PorA